MDSVLDLHALLALALLCALVIDHYFGEPSPAWHPVVWMGRYLNFAGQWVAPKVDSPGSDRAMGPFIRGALAWLAGAIIVASLAWILQLQIVQWPAWVALPCLAFLLKTMFSWRMLRTEVRAVEMALTTSLASGRERLAGLCSREVHALDATEVRECAIESLAENLNDSVVAPLFWFVLAGLPGAALYRFANTADAMWGYRGVRGGRDWAWAGKWTARVDDALSWLPARLTAVMMLLGCGRTWLPGLRHEAARTPSPNGGWPMGAMAMLLGVGLGKPGVYRLNPNGRAVLPGDLSQSIGIATRGIGWTVVLCGLILGARHA